MKRPKKKRVTNKDILREIEKNRRADVARRLCSQTPELAEALREIGWKP